MNFTERMQLLEEKLFDNPKFIEILKVINSKEWPNNIKARVDLVYDLEDVVLEIVAKEIFEEASKFEETLMTENLEQLESLEDLENIEGFLDLPPVDQEVEGFFLATLIEEDIEQNERFYSNPYSIIEIYFINLRQQYQDYCIASGQIEKEEVELLRKNLLISPVVPDKVSVLEEDHPLYDYQPITLDNRKYTNKIMDQVVKSSARNCGITPNLEVYLSYYHYKNKNSDNKIKEREALELINKTYDEIKDENTMIDEFLEKYESIETKDLDDQVLYTFLAPMFDDLLPIDDRAEILLEVCNRETEKYGIEPVYEFKPVNDFELYSSIIASLSARFIGSSDALIKSLGDTKISADLAINLYKAEDGTRPNIIDLKTIEGQIQPIVLFCKDIENKIVKKVEHGLRENFKEDRFVNQVKQLESLNYQELISKLENYYGLRIDKIYQNLIKDMKKKIDLDKSKTQRGR